MTRHSIHPRDPIFLKSYGFLSFAKNTIKHKGKNINKNLSGKYSQKLLNHAKRSATDARKTTSRKVIQKTAEGFGDLIGNQIADKVMKVSRTSPQNSLQLKMKQKILGMIKRYLKKKIYLRKKDRKLLMI